MGIIQRILEGLFRQVNTGGSSNQPRRETPVANEHPCQNGCGRMTWTGPSLCKTCHKQANFGLKQPSPSQKESYNRVIAMAGSTGMSESALKSDLVNKYSFNQGDVDLLVASPTFRQLMGWA